MKEKLSTHMPQLDALRAIAIALVIIEHYFPQSKLNYLPLGKMGVLLFFVLSGYLISNILFKEKNKIDDSKTTIKKSIKKFFIRRFLRIFPIYYLTIAFFLLFNYNAIQEKYLWYLSYSSNIFSYINQAWDGTTGPYWTLAVEEQFYLIWPFFIFLTPYKVIKKAIYLVIFSGMFFRLLFICLSNNLFDATNYELALVLMPSTIDSFALGALLAFYKNSNISYKYNITIIIFATLSFLLINHFLKKTYSYYIFSPFFFSIISFYIVGSLSNGVKNITKFFLENRIVMFLGKISYGIYLYHVFPWLVFGLFSFFERKYSPFSFKISTFIDTNVENKALMYIGIVIIMSSISWLLIEKPINGLKKYYKY